MACPVFMEGLCVHTTDHADVIGVTEKSEAQWPPESMLD